MIGKSHLKHAQTTRLSTIYGLTTQLCENNVSLAKHYGIVSDEKIKKDNNTI